MNRSRSFWLTSGSGALGRVRPVGLERSDDRTPCGFLTMRGRYPFTSLRDRLSAHVMPQVLVDVPQKSVHAKETARASGAFPGWPRDSVKHATYRSDRGRQS